RGQRGEELVKSDLNMLDYYHMPEATQEALKDEFLHTGDVGYFDEDDCLHIDGRIQDMFIVGGVNCYPLEIEHLIMDMDGIEDAQVVGVPDARLGEVGCAYVIRKEGSSISEQDIIDHCSELANYKIPRYVRFVDSYPETANGKIKKYVLKEMFESEQSPDS
ncbi:MAG: AMP-binding protein, partial [Eggerthellaceae bacterium]|nr:AMP-binding protein [Eggerthellaceae bacterium]